jgi:hypothetical protein
MNGTQRQFDCRPTWKQPLLLHNPVIPKVLGLVDSDSAADMPRQWTIAAIQSIQWQLQLREK